MKKTFRLLLILLITVFVSSCKREGMISFHEAIRKGNTAVVYELSSYDKDRILEEWGPPEYVAMSSSDTIKWTDDKGTVILTFENDKVVMAETVKFHKPPWPFSLLADHGAISVLAAIAFIVIPLLLIFVVISMIFHKAGWMGNDEEDKDHGKEIFFSKPGGSKPWSGI